MPTYDDGYGKGYFTCPRCKETFDYNEFNEFEHITKADPSDRTILGQAKCPNCPFEFHYYLTSDCLPIIKDVNEAPPPLAPIFASHEEDEPPVTKADMLVFSQLTNEAPYENAEERQDSMGRLKQALESIDKYASPPDRNNKISESLEILIGEPQPQVEAGLDLIKDYFKLNSRNIEAFRGELNKKRKQFEKDKEIDKHINNIENAFSNISQPPKSLTDEEKAEAIAYLEDPELFDNISRDIALAGDVIGEEANKMMLYLAATSRMFKQPISLVIFGKSSGGKSHLANAIEKFMPEEDAIALSSMTARVLEYAVDQLKHKLLLVQEWEGLKDALPTIRTLQSEGILNRYHTGRDKISKDYKAVSSKHECPCSVIVTTTKEGIHDENSTRIFELYVDETQEQTERVVRYNIMKADKTYGVPEEEKQRIMDLHHNVQRSLKSVGISIPYARHITFPGKTTRHRRDSERFIKLIKAVAFLRQMQKEKVHAGGVDWIEADLDDYYFAYKIGADIIRATLNPISDRAKNALNACCSLHEKSLDARKDPVFTVTDIQEAAEVLGSDFRNRTDLYKQLEMLEEYEYIEKNQKNKHATRYYNICFKYERDENGEITNVDSPDIKMILTPDQLREKIEGEPREMEVVPESVCRHAPELSRAE